MKKNKLKLIIFLAIVFIIAIGIYFVINSSIVEQKIIFKDEPLTIYCPSAKEGIDNQVTINIRSDIRDKIVDTWFLFEYDHSLISLNDYKYNHIDSSGVLTLNFEVLGKIDDNATGSFKIFNIHLKTKNSKYYYTYPNEIKIDFPIYKMKNYSIDDNGKIVCFYKGEGKEKVKINSYTYPIDDRPGIGWIYGNCVQWADYDDGIAIIWNFTNQKEYKTLFDFNKGILLEMDDMELWSEKYFLGRKNNEEFIVDFNGKIIKSLNGYDKVFQLHRKGGYTYTPINIYSIDYDMVVLSKNGKKGITKITTEEVLVDYKYDDVRLYNDKYFKYKIDDLWYVGTFEDDNNYNNMGYKELFMVSDDLMFAQIDNYLYIKHFNGTNITDDKIEVFHDYVEDIHTREQQGIENFYVGIDYNEKNIVIISVLPANSSYYDKINYKYNISENKLFLES